MRSIASALLPVTLGLSLLGSRDARAQSQPGDGARRAEARAIAELGDAAFASGRCDQAIPLWKRADASYHAPTLMLRVARCQSLLGRVVDANATLRAMLDERLADDAPAAFVAARESAERELPTTLERIASLTVRVAGPTNVAAVVEVDGLAAAVGMTLALDPGEHRVFVRALGATYERTVSLKDGEAQAITVSVALSAPPPVASTQRKVGLAIGGVGVGAMALGGVFGVLALSSAGGLSSACGADRQHCPAGDQPNIDALKSRALVADLALGTGFALLAGGVVVAVTSTPARSEPLVVHLSASLGGLAVDGSF